MEEGQKTANWEQLLMNKIKIIVNVKDYCPAKEDRLLVPFISESNRLGQANKIGLLNRDGEVIVEPLYDTILDDCYSPNDLIRVGTLFPYGYSRKSGGVSSYVRYKYKIVNSTGVFITDMEYDSIAISSDKRLITVQDVQKGYAVYDVTGNEIVPFGKYAWIDCFDNGLCRVIQWKMTNDIENPEKKWGIINTKGKEVLPLEYDNIWKFFGKNRISTKVIKRGIAKEIYFDELNLQSYKSTHSIREETEESYGTHYGEYAGTYAQDVMGYSDDAINDAFDGDPDAYWNID